MTLEFESIIAILSVTIPLVAFVWEFAVVRRKRLGYRVQMDTLASDPAQALPGPLLPVAPVPVKPVNAGPGAPVAAVAAARTVPAIGPANVLAQMHENGRKLDDPSFVLVRIENAGWIEIVESDYLTPENDRTGIRVTFRGRRVVDLAVSETSQPELADFFFTQDADGRTRKTDGFGIGEENGAGIVRLPKVKLNPGAYYKVLAVLERQSGSPGDRFPAPTFRADVSGRHNRWFNRLARLRLAPTESHTFASRPAVIGIVLLALATLAQAGLTLFWPRETPPLDCVGGTLHLHGSTAFEPAVRRAAQRYVQLCGGKGARIPLGEGAFGGSTKGITVLEQAGAAMPEGAAGLGDHITFTDGYAEGNHPRVLPRPVAYGLFTLVTNEDVAVRDLSTAQVRDIYARRITDWSQVGGPRLPIRLVNRHPGSGTRTALVNRVLDGRDVPGHTVNDCAALDPAGPGVCEVDSTRDLLGKVATIPGALGYSEVSNAATAKGTIPVRIDHWPATLSGAEDGRYPYWQTEYAYTYGELPAESIGAAFLRYLTDQGGKDILREFGNRPCSETDFPLECRPQ